MAYREVLPHSKSRPIDHIQLVPELDVLWNALRYSINNSTWLALGATIQTCILLLPVPRLFAVAPAVFFVMYRIVLTCLVTYKLLPNSYMKGVIPYRYTAIVPDIHGNFPAQNEIPTKNKIAVLILCARANHPAGWLGAPHTKRFGELFDKMSDDLRKWPQEQTGYLGQSQAFMPSSDGTIELLNISYWRSKEHILKYADSPSHREAMRWWTELGAYDGSGGKISHIGIGHEIYESEAGNWESIYMGYQPTLLAATSYLKTGDQSEKTGSPNEWISPILEARRGKLAGSRGRMGIPINSKLHEMTQM